MVWTAAGGVKKNIKAKMLNISLVAGLIASLAVPSLVPLFGNRAEAATTVNSQADLVAAVASSEAVINIGSSFFVTSQVNIDRTLTLNGNGHTISTSYTASGGGNDTALAVVGGNPTINNLVIDGTSGVMTQGIQVWQSAATLNNITSRNNDKAGIHINGSTASISNVKTENNGSNYGGIMVSNNGTVTINGSSQHSENTNAISGQKMDIYVSFGHTGTVNDTNLQYNNWLGLGIVYTLKPVVDTAKPTVSNISINPTINGNIGKTVTVKFDLNDTTGVDLTKTRLLFADGPNLSGRARESAKYIPVLVPGTTNTYEVVIDTTIFLKQNHAAEYNLAFNLWDVLGNQGSSKPADFRRVLIDNSGPTATMSSPISGSKIKATQRFSFNITDHTGVASAYMKLNGPSNKTINLTRGVGDEWYADVDTSELTDGNYTVDIRPIDVFGTPRYNANRGAVTIDNSMPVWNSNPVHLSPADNAEVIEGSNILMEWSDAIDPHGVKYYYQSSYSDETNGSDNGFVNPIWTWGPLTTPKQDATGTAVGTYFWQVKACDDLGNCTDWTNPWTGSVVSTLSTGGTGGSQVQGARTNGGSGNSNPTPNSLAGQTFARAIGGDNNAFGQPQNDEDNDDEGQVESANIENDFASVPATLAAASVNDSNSCSKILGLCWYYWPPIIVAILTIGYIGYKRTQEKN